MKRIEDGEAKINRRIETESLLKEKVSKYRDPFNQLAISYENQSNQFKVSKFNEEEDRYLLCMSQRLGYGNWEGIKAEDLVSQSPSKRQWPSFEKHGA